MVGDFAQLSMDTIVSLFYGVGMSYSCDQEQFEIHAQSDGDQCCDIKTTTK